MKHERRTSCKHCGAHGTWLQDEEDPMKMTFVDIPGYGKHICLKNRKSPIEQMVAASKPAPGSLVFYSGDKPPILPTPPNSLEERVVELETQLASLINHLKNIK